MHARVLCAFNRLIDLIQTFLLTYTGWSREGARGHGPKSPTKFFVL